MKSRRSLVVGAVLGVCVLLAGVAVWIAVASMTGASSTSAAPVVPRNTVQCQYVTADEPGSRSVGTPSGRAQDTGTVGLQLVTNLGTIPLVLDRSKAPCAVQSIVFLASKGFYNGTSCNQLDLGQHMKVLKCGDPSDYPLAGPGYQFSDKLPDLPSAGNGDDYAVYRQGTVAMANNSPDGNGSQFFLFFGESWYSKGHPVIGTYGARAQNIMDGIGAAGSVRYVLPGTDVTSSRPANPVTIGRVLGG